MLDQLRALFPAAHSWLMDRATLLSHRALWGREDAPFRGVLTRLDPSESELFDAIVNDRLGDSLRLEQERILFGHVCETLRNLVGDANHLALDQGV